MSEQYVVMAMDYTVRRGAPEIHYFVRRTDGFKNHFTVSYRPYFYGPWDERPEIEKEGPYEAVDGRQVGKIYTQLPKEVPELAKKFSKAYEDKIPFPLRWLIDKRIKATFAVDKEGECSPVPDFHCPMVVCTLDIEVEITQRQDKWSTIQDAMMGKQMIIAICWQIGKERKQFVAKDELEEQRMLREFIEDVKLNDPDTITGWNVTFDLTCIVNRCHYHQINPNDLSPMYWVDVREREVHIAGRNVFDLREGFRKYFQGRVFDSYALEDIAARPEILGMAKIKVDYKEQMNRHHLDVIKPYNERDVELTVKINEKLDIINHFDGVRRVAGCRMEDSLQTSKYADIAMLRQYHGKFVLGTKGYDEVKQKVEGAFVLTPKRGVHKNIILLDFGSMYPSIIMSNNMSPECLCGPEETDAFEIEGVRFRKNPKGIVPLTIEEFMQFRKSVKSEMKKYARDDPMYAVLDLRQYSIKQMIAAIYGFFGFVGSRLYYPKIAGSITAMGRKNLRTTVTFLAEQGYECIYGDTDSLMIQVKGDLMEEGHKIEQMVNEFWKKKAKEQGMYLAPTMEFEIAYSHFLLSVKKRYAGRCTFYKGRPSDEIILKGFEAKRSDSSLVTRKVQKDVINMILMERPEQEIRNYIRKVDISTLPFEEIGIPDPMRMPPEMYKNPASILHVFYSNRFLGKTFQQDSRPYVFYIRRVKDGLPATITLITSKGPKSYKVDRIALENEKDLEEWKPYIDWEVQAEKVLENKLEPILTAYGITISEVMSGQKQASLEAWG